jgi:beta-lactam-binding protein with PASTA domain
MATRERPGLSSAPTELIGPPAPPPAEPEPPPDRELWPWLLVLSVLVIAGLAAVWYATRDSTGAAGPVTVQTTVAAQPATTVAAQPATTAATTTARTTAAPPRAVVVPDLVGQNGDEAVRTLEAQSLRPDVREVPSTEADGIVVSQHPAGGATVEARAGVLLNVAHHVEQPQPKPQPNGDENSQGDGHDQASALQTPVVATVPNVVGEDKDAAKADLAGAGFHVDKKNQDTSDPSQDGMVVDQSPPGGGSAPAGSHVTIYVARYRD